MRTLQSGRQDGEQERTVPSKPAGTYQQALRDLIAAVKDYNGGPIPPHEGETEHPLHLAVRNVESWWHYKTDRGRGPLPNEAWAIWLGLLASCREYTADEYVRFRTRIDRVHRVRGVAWHVSYELSRPGSDPNLAIAAAYDLASWAAEQLTMLGPPGTGTH